MILTPEQIKAAREESGLSKKELADLIGTSEKSVQYYESGERNPKYDKMLKIVEVLKIGDRTNVSNKVITNEVRPVPFENYMEVPFKPVYAQAGNLIGFGQDEIDTTNTLMETIPNKNFAPQEDS